MVAVINELSGGDRALSLRSFKERVRSIEDGRFRDRDVKRTEAAKITDAHGAW